PVCSIGLDLDDIPCVLVNNAQGMHAIVAHVLDTHGCRRVAYIGGPAHNQEAQERERAYRRALEERSIPQDDSLVVHGHFYFSHGAEGMRELISRGVDFDAVVAANDYMALGAMGVLTELGRRVPEDVIVCGFDDINVARFTSTSLTTIRQPVRRL